MADISSFTDLSGNTYNFKDTTARGSLVPSGGSDGQVLTRVGSQGAYAWQDPSGGGNVNTVNQISPDANGNVDIDATDIPTSSGVAIKSLIGNPLTIADALQGRALGVNATIEPIQDLHGYDHPWPAGGGKNLLDESIIEQGQITSTGVASADNRCRTSWSAPIPVIEGSTYTVSGTVTGGVFNVFISVYENNTDTSRSADSGWRASGYPYTIPSGGAYIRLTFRRNDNSNVTPSDFSNIQLELGSTATDYEPYSNICPISGISSLEIANNGTTEVTVALGQTVYGGTLNVSTGELVVNKGYVDLGTLNWVYRTSSNTNAFVAGNFVNKLYASGAIPPILCSNYPTVEGAWSWSAISNYPDKTISYHGQNGNNVSDLFVKDSAYTDAATFKTAMNGVQLVYELATPLTFNLTSAQLNLLSSTNILTSNAEDLTVRYYATGQQGNVEGNLAFLLGQTASNASAITALSESVAPEETSPATATHATGTYLMYQNRLYKVIASIAVGETLTVGTNIQATTIMAELLALTV